MICSELVKQLLLYNIHRFETVNGMASPKIQKVLINIRKTTERAKKKKHSEKEEDESEGEDYGKARPES